MVGQHQDAEDGEDAADAAVTAEDIVDIPLDIDAGRLGAARDSPFVCVVTHTFCVASSPSQYTQKGGALTRRADKQ